MWPLAALVGLACSSGGADDHPVVEPGALSCSSPQLACDGKCIDPRSDSGHCGATASCTGSSAGASCAHDQSCVGGVCGSACPSGGVRCGGQCIDAQTDANHCGASGDCVGARAGSSCAPSIGRCGTMVSPQCRAGSCSSGCPSGAKHFDFTGRLESFTTPDCVAELTIQAAGAQGGTAPEGSAGGSGATASGTFCLPPGTVLTIAVGEQPPSAHTCGGGGGSYVGQGMSALVVAGGGGGGYYNWPAGGAADTLATLGSGKGGAAYQYAGGGGGFAASGLGMAGSGGGSFQSGATAGVIYPVGDVNLGRGGFGGGGGASETGGFNSGGGGGYDGGNAGLGNASHGGTSFVSPQATSPTFKASSHSHHGSVDLSW